MATASRRCMVFKCGKTSKDRNLSFHSFPKRKDIRDQWVHNVKLGQPNWTVPKCSSSKYYAICSRHFEPNCFRTVKHKYDMASRNTLKLDAVPTLYMNGQPEPELPISLPSDGLPSEEDTASKRLEVPSENGDFQNSSHGGEDSAIPQEIIQNSSSNIICTRPYYENPPELYSATCSGYHGLINTNVDEKSPKKYALASRRCMVFGCGSTSRNRNLSFHAFPKKTELREEWISRIRINRPNWSPNWPESNYYAVCSRHFTPDCFKTMKHNFCSTSRNTLRPDAVPSLYLPGETGSVQTFNEDYLNQHQSIPYMGHEVLMNGDDKASSYQQSSDYQGLIQSEDDNSWMSSALPTCMMEVHSENGDWSPEELAFTDASTQTIAEDFTNHSSEGKQTRTVRVQTIITIRKSVETKETQYELPKSTKDEGTHYEQCSSQSQVISSQSVKSPTSSENLTPLDEVTHV